MCPCCRAQKLIAGLGGEKSRWTAAASRLGQEYVQLIGDVLLAAAQIAYLGAFTSTYRSVSWLVSQLAVQQQCEFAGTGVIGQYTFCCRHLCGMLCMRKICHMSACCGQHRVCDVAGLIACTAGLLNAKHVASLAVTGLS